MADTATVGILKTMLTMDTASFEAGSKKGVSSGDALKKSITGLGEEVKKLTPLAERMVRGFGGDKLLHTANSLTAAVTKLGGASKLTEAEQARVNKTLGDAITKYQKLGQEAPKAMVDLERATRSATARTDVFTTKMVALGAAAGVFAAQLVGQVIRGVVNMGREAFDSAGKILDLAQATGLSTKTIQQMQFVADQTSTSIDTFTTAAFNLGRSIAGGGPSIVEALRKLGIEWAQIRGLSMDQQWNMVTIALSKYTNEGERNRIGMTLMGKTFKDVAKSMGDGYEDLTKQAKTSTDAQLKELDRLNDAWTAFKRNLTTGFGAAMGRMVVESRIRREVVEEFFRRRKDEPGFKGFTEQPLDGQFLGRPLNVEEEAQRRIQLEILNGVKDKDIALTQQQATAQVNYATRLREATAELKKLDAGERQQIASAQSLGAEQDELVSMLIRFGVEADKAEDVLKIYSGTMKEAAKDSKALAEEARKFHEGVHSMAEVFGQWVQVVDGSAEGRKDLMRFFTAMPLAIESMGASIREDLIPAMQGLGNQLGMAAPIVLSQGAAERIGDETKQQVQDQLEALQAFRDTVSQLFAPLFGGVTGGISDLLFGRGGSDAREAKREYEALRRSGTASAEELMRAYQRVRDTQRSMWASFTSGVMDSLKNLLNYFVNSFLQGMVRAIAGTSFGKSVSGFLSSALGIGAGVGAGGAGAGAAAAATGTSAMALSPGFVASLGGTGTTTAAGGGIAGGLAAIGPIAAFASAAIWALTLDGVNKEMSDFLLSSKGDWRKRPQAFMASKGVQGFHAPSVSMPGRTGMSFGNNSGQSPFAQTARSGDRTVVVNISAIDARGVRDFFRSKEATDAISFIFNNNDGFVATNVERSLRP